MNARPGDVLDEDAGRVVDCLRFAKRYGIARAAARYGVSQYVVRRWREALLGICTPGGASTTRMRVVSCYLHHSVKLVELECQHCGLVVYMPEHQELEHCPSCCRPISGLYAEGD